MPFTPLPLINFVRGVVSDFGRLAQPRGSVQRISNLFYKRIGSLTTIDGTKIVSNAAGGPSKFVAMGVYNNGVTNKIIALSYAGGGSTNLGVNDITGATWTTITTITEGGASVPGIDVLADMLMFNGSLIIVPSGATSQAGAGGGSNHIWSFNGTTATALTNSWTRAGYLSKWTASTAYVLGDVISPVTPGDYAFRVIQAGTSGTVQPTWPATQGGTVPDNTVVWQAYRVAVGGTVIAPFQSTRHAIAHLGSLFLYGSTPASDGTDSNSLLAQSDVLNANSWNPANAIFVGGSDGQIAQGGVSFAVAEAGIAPDPRMALFKDFSTYEFVGLFPNAQAILSKTDMGCIAPRSIQFVAELAGAIRFTHRGFALYRGAEAGGDTLLTEQLKSYIFGGATDITPVDIPNALYAKSALSVNPPMYLCALPLQGGGGALTRVFMLDIEMMKTANAPVWAIADLPWAITSMALIKVQGAAPVLYIAPGSTDNTVRRWMAGDPDWDGTAVNWSFKGPHLFDPQKPQSVFYFRKESTAGTGTGKVTAVSLDYNNPANGAENTKTIPMPTAGIGIPMSKSLDQLNRGGALTISGTGPVVIEAVDVEVQPRGERPYAQS